VAEDRAGDIARLFFGRKMAEIGQDGDLGVGDDVSEFGQ
jgi:hypothetical protein